MKAFKKNISAEEYPYIGYVAHRPTHKPPTPPQQRVLDQMEHGMWYEPETIDENGKCKDRLDSCYALVAKGLLVYAKLGIKKDNGTIKEPSPEEMLLDFIFKDRTFHQPFTLFRKAVDIA